MPDGTTAESGYTMGYNEEFRQLLDRRSAATHAAYLLPHLQPGMRVLDLGCGPGTISVGLADAVSPGELHGIDLEESQVAMARVAAEAGGHGNATFHAGDATDLPFEDGEFDAVHCHAVLMHIPDTAAALAEVRRVLKPGGLFAAREVIVDSCFLEPVEPEVAEAWTIFAKLVKANGGTPRWGAS
ncbi:MAG: class I SAM-dependent methyltransferase [Chloroflexi bacterium]|nr:class I SAM-dependent methyltransferase [Chloroflexota bacterium]